MFDTTRHVKTCLANFCITSGISLKLKINKVTIVILTLKKWFHTLNFNKVTIIFLLN